MSACRGVLSLKCALIPSDALGTNSAVLPCLEGEVIEAGDLLTCLGNYVTFSLGRVFSSSTALLLLLASFVF